MISTAFSDILFDADELVKKIEPAAWGQGFKDRRGYGISLDRLIGCMREARVKPADNEGYTQRSSTEILINMFLLTAGYTPLCKSASQIRARLGDVIQENTKRFSHGEQVLLETLANLVDDDQKLRFYLMFQEDLDRLLRLAARR
jgi:hypothetical protein